MAGRHLVSMQESVVACDSRIEEIIFIYLHVELQFCLVRNINRSTHEYYVLHL